jgi:ribonuclease HI
MLAEYDITETTCSNPTAEFLAFSTVLSEFIDLKPATPLTLRFYIDYIGIKQWMSGSWQTKESYIRIIKDICDCMIDSMTCRVEIVHVKGHSGNHGNEMADACATDTSEYNNFYELREVLDNLS